MGTLVGHVAPGMMFALIGLWHLINHTKLHTLNPTTYTSLPWFPVSKPIRHLELYLIMAATSASIAMELFIGPQNHQPLDSDGSIPSNHLHNFEHSSISLAFLLYALLSLILEKTASISNKTLIISSREFTQLLAALAFAQQFLIFHLHSADHAGPEGQYHLLLQVIVFISLLTTLMWLGFPRSFLLSFVRSISVFFQGVWLVVMGFALWTPGLIAKGCFMHEEKGHIVVRCSGDESLHRAKSLVNLQFSWFLSGIVVFGIFLYLITVKFYESDGNVEYSSLILKAAEEEEEGNSGDIDVESQKKPQPSCGRNYAKISFMNDMEKSGINGPTYMERYKIYN